MQNWILKLMDKRTMNDDRWHQTKEDEKCLQIVIVCIKILVSIGGNRQVNVGQQSAQFQLSIRRSFRFFSCCLGRDLFIYFPNNNKQLEKTRKKCTIEKKRRAVPHELDVYFHSTKKESFDYNKLTDQFEMIYIIYLLWRWGLVDFLVVCHCLM